MLTNIAPYFERNRAFAGLVYKFNDKFVLQPGYIYQFNYHADNTKSGKGFFQFFVFIELANVKIISHHKLPAAID